MLKPERVRIPDRSEEEDLVAVCRELHAENGMFALNEDKVRNMLYQAFDRKGGVLGVIGDPGRVEGMICLIMSTFWYSNDIHLEELFSYVRPAYRRSSNAKELLEFAKWCETETSFPLLIGIQSNIRTKAKVHLYKRALGEPIGAFFLYRHDQPAVAETESSVDLSLTAEEATLLHKLWRSKFKHNDPPKEVRSLGSELRRVVEQLSTKAPPAG